MNPSPSAQNPISQPLKWQIPAPILSLQDPLLIPDFKESDDAESFQRNCRVSLLAITRIWKEQCFLSLIRGQKKAKTLHRLQKETLQSLVLITYLLPIESFCDRLRCIDF